MCIKTSNDFEKINHVSHVFCKFWRNMGTTQQLLRAKNCTKDTTFDKIIAIHNLGKLTDDKQSIAKPLTCLNCFCWVHFKNFATKKQHSYFTKSAVLFLCCFFKLCLLKVVLASRSFVRLLAFVQVPLQCKQFSKGVLIAIGGG